MKSRVLGYRRESLTFNEDIETKRHEPCELDLGRFGESLLPFLDTISLLVSGCEPSNAIRRGVATLIPTYIHHLLLFLITFDSSPYSSIDLNEICRTQLNLSYQSALLQELSILPFHFFYPHFFALALSYIFTFVSKSCAA